MGDWVSGRLGVGDWERWVTERWVNMWRWVTHNPPTHRLRRSTTSWPHWYWWCRNLGTPTDLRAERQANIEFRMRMIARLAVLQ